MSHILFYLMRINSRVFFTISLMKNRLEKQEIFVFSFNKFFYTDSHRKFLCATRHACIECKFSQILQCGAGISEPAGFSFNNK